MEPKDFSIGKLLSSVLVKNFAITKYKKERKKFCDFMGNVESINPFSESGQDEREKTYKEQAEVQSLDGEDYEVASELRFESLEKDLCSVQGVLLASVETAKREVHLELRDNLKKLELRMERMEKRISDMSELQKEEGSVPKCLRVLFH